MSLSGTPRSLLLPPRVLERQAVPGENLTTGLEVAGLTAAIGWRGQQDQSSAVVMSGTWRAQRPSSRRQ